MLKPMFDDAIHTGVSLGIAKALESRCPSRHLAFSGEKPCQCPITDGSACACAAARAPQLSFIEKLFGKVVPVAAPMPTPGQAMRALIDIEVRSAIKATRPSANNVSLTVAIGQTA